MKLHPCKGKLNEQYAKAKLEDGEEGPYILPEHLRPLSDLAVTATSDRPPKGENRPSFLEINVSTVHLLDDLSAYTSSTGNSRRQGTM